jgi:prolyl-tRNA editing enzyme YbaK/EbsC (Cys-tRNA(Pro) deacylase)
MSYAYSNRVTSPQTHTYATDIRSAHDVAHVLGIPAYAVYQTLVVLPPHGKPLLMIIPGPWALDLKRLAQALVHNQAPFFGMTRCASGSQRS